MNQSFPKMFNLIKLLLFLFVLYNSKPINKCLNMSVKKAIEEFEVYPDLIKTIPKEIIDVSILD